MRKELFLISILLVCFLAKVSFGQQAFQITIESNPTESCYEILTSTPGVMVIRNDETVREIQIGSALYPLEADTSFFAIRTVEGDKNKIELLSKNGEALGIANDYRKGMLTLGVIKVKNQVVENCDAEDDPEEPESSIDAVLFVPKDYKKARAVAATTSSASTIIYNKGTGAFSYPGKKSSRKFRPRIDESYSIEVVGYHPYQDSLGAVKIDFVTRNQEYSERFFPDNFISGDKKEDDEKTGDKKETDNGETVAGAQAEEGDVSLEQKIDCFQKELREYYFFQLNNPTLSINSLRGQIATIQSNIISVFDGEEVSVMATLSEVKSELEEQGLVDAYLAKLNQGIGFYKKILGYNEIKVPGFQIKDSDVTEITFDWYKIGNKSPSMTSERTLFNKGGLAIDFSAGLILYGLVDHQFTTVPTAVYDSTYNDSNELMIDTTTKARVVQELSDEIDWSAGVLAHFYYRNMLGSNRLNLGLTTGLLADNVNADFKVRPMFGGSVILGSEQRIVLSGGVILGKVSRLGEGLEAGEHGSLLEIIPEKETTVTTRDVNKCSWFISVTYNFRNNNSQK